MSFSYTPSPPPDKRRKRRKRSVVIDRVTLVFASALITLAVILLMATSHGR